MGLPKLIDKYRLTNEQSLLSIDKYCLMND